MAMFSARLDAERDVDMEIPALADHADGRGLRRPAAPPRPGSLAGAAAGPAGHAEGDELWRASGRRRAKKASSVGLAPGQPPST